MTILRLQYRFSAEVWQYAGQGSWYFVSLPVKLSKEIRSTFRSQEAGWGRLTATAFIGKSEWKTAIWFDSKRNTYLLPLKAEIRDKEKLAGGKKVKVTVYI